jgi:drug/metabolite transporter (DMT)-like permease
LSWINTAILSAGILGFVNIIDSHLVSRRMPSVRAFLLPVGIIHLVYGLVLLIIFPFPQGVGAWPFGIAVVSGFIRSVAITIMFYIMTREEVSRVIPVVYTYPIFVAIAAVVLLGEDLVSLQWLAIIIVVAGAIMVSLRRSPTGSGAYLGRSFGLLLISSLLMAAADVTSKYALNYISFWNMYSLTVFCMSSFFFLISLRRSVFRELRSMERRGSAMALLAFNEVLAPAGILFSFWAIERGPVSLVSTILGSRPIFVFIFALVLGRIFPVLLDWRPTKETLMLRLTATVMITGGIAIIHLL